MRSHAGQWQAEYGSRPLASEQVQGKVRVYSGCTVDMYCTVHLYSRQR